MRCKTHHDDSGSVRVADSRQMMRRLAANPAGARAVDRVLARWGAEPMTIKPSHEKAAENGEDWVRGIPLGRRGELSGPGGYARMIRSKPPASAAVSGSRRDALVGLRRSDWPGAASSSAADRFTIGRASLEDGGNLQDALGWAFGDPVAWPQHDFWILGLRFDRSSNGSNLQEGSASTMVQAMFASILQLLGCRRDLNARDGCPQHRRKSAAGDGISAAATHRTIVRIGRSRPAVPRRHRACPTRTARSGHRASSALCDRHNPGGSLSLGNVPNRMACAEPRTRPRVRSLHQRFPMVTDVSGDGLRTVRRTRTEGHQAIFQQSVEPCLFWPGYLDRRSRYQSVSESLRRLVCDTGAKSRWSRRAGRCRDGAALHETRPRTSTGPHCSADLTFTTRARSNSAALPAETDAARDTLDQSDSWMERKPKSRDFRVAGLTASFSGGFVRNVPAHCRTTSRKGCPTVRRGELSICGFRSSVTSKPGRSPDGVGD